jgi:hypothetical protein
MASSTRIDGTPRLSAGNPGSVGGLKDGRALRHADGTEPPQENFGWLDRTAAAKTVSDRTGAYVQIGPGSAAWRAPQGKFTTGMQRGGKPRR